MTKKNSKKSTKKTISKTSTKKTTKKPVVKKPSKGNGKTDVKQASSALDVICQKCGAFPKRRCKNVITGEMRMTPHNIRVADSQNPVVKAAASVPLPAKPKNPKEKLNPEQRAVVDTVLEKIEALGKHAKFVGPVSTGPVISTYRFFPLRRTKVAHLEAMAKDFAVSLGAEAILVKRMPGESAVGVFVPNAERKFIDFKDTIPHIMSYIAKPTSDGHIPLPMNFGQLSDGTPFVEDLTELPHLLIGGATGGGKSTIMHSIVTGLVFARTSKEVQMFISDTKGVEFRHFGTIPHLKMPIATSVYQTMEQLQFCIDETQNRLDKIGMKGVRNIHEYNKLMSEDQKMPYIVFVIDELNDIMGQHLGSEAKLNAAKLGAVVARSRASGIYVIAGTQRPDVKVVAGTIKANFPARLAFRTSSAIDSRTILNTKGAEHLMSKGDMLYISPTNPELRRMHAPYTSIEDVKACVQFVVGREISNSADAAQNGGAPAQAGATFRIQ